MAETTCQLYIIYMIIIKSPVWLHNFFYQLFQAGNVYFYVDLSKYLWYAMLPLIIDTTFTVKLTFNNFNISFINI